MTATTTGYPACENKACRPHPKAILAKTAAIEKLEKHESRKVEKICQIFKIFKTFTAESSKSGREEREKEKVAAFQHLGHLGCHCRTKWCASTLRLEQRRPGRETQTAAAFFVENIRRIFGRFVKKSNHTVEITPITPIAARARSASTSSTNTRISMFFPKPFPKTELHCLAAQARVGTTRQLLCSHAAQLRRRHFLRKSARKVSSSFFSEKKKLNASKPSAKSQQGPQPRLQANAVLSKIAKCLAHESNALASAER